MRAVHRDWTGVLVGAVGWLVAGAAVVRADADLELTKRANLATPVLGQQIQYTLVVVNLGPSTANGIQVRDVLPAGMTYISHLPVEASYDPGTGIWNVGTVQNQGNRTLIIIVRVDTVNPTTNVAEIIASDQADRDSTPNNGVTTEDDYAVATVTPNAPRADLNLSMSVSDVTPLLNSEDFVQLNVGNTGPQGATGVGVTCLLPPGFTYLSHTPPSDLYNPDTGLWIVGDIANQQGRPLSIRVRVDTLEQRTFVSEITSSGTSDPDSTPNNGNVNEDDYDSVVVSPHRPLADLSIRMTATPPNPALNAQVSISITVLNEGPNHATGIQVKDLIPAGMTYLSDNGSSAYVPPTGIWTVGTLESGTARRLDILASADTLGTKTNVAEIVASDMSDPDSVPNNQNPSEDDYAFVLITPLGTPLSDLSLTKGVSNSNVLVGDLVTFVLSLSNTGPGANSGVEVLDRLPNSAAYVSHTGPGTYDPGTGVWNIGPVSVQQSRVLQITTRITAAGSTINNAQVSAALVEDPDSTPNNNNPKEDDQSSVSVNATATSADLGLSMVVDNSSPSPGQDILYFVGLRNDGPNNATGIQVTAPLPSGLTYLNHAAGGTYTPATGLWNVGNLNSSQSTNLQIQVRVNPNGVMVFTAEVIASNLPDPDSTPNNHNPYEDDQVSNRLNVVVSCIRGDLNTDGSKNINDLARFIQVLLNPLTATVHEWCAMDVNADGRRDGVDIKAFITGL